MRTHQNTTTIAALTLIASAGLAQDFNWDMPASGDWTNAANWTEMAVPNDPSHSAFISVLGTYTISIPTVINTLDVSVTNPNATILLEGGDTHNMFGNFHNDGLYQINPAGTSAQTLLVFQNTAAVGGTGMIQLGAFDTRARINVNPGATLENSTDHTIAGVGRITGDITNNGLIDADVSGGFLNYQSGTPTNNALMLASAGSLDLTGITVNQHPLTGFIRADGGFVQINGTTINDGTVEGLNTFVEVDGNSTFNDVTTNGDVRVEAGRTLNINSTLTNLGTLGVNLGGVATQTSLTAQSDTLITGTGDIRLDGSSNRAQITAQKSAIITNDSMHTINGFGRITAGMLNHGQIIADVNEQVLTINSSAFVNDGELASDGNSFLDISSSNIVQSKGATINVIDGEVRYLFSTISGGTLIGDTGIHFVSNNSTFDQVTNEHDITVSAGRVLGISNSITNNGYITINQGNVAAQTTLNFLDSSALAGSGTLLLNGVVNRAQITAESGMTVTNDADHTIMGFGRITADMINDGNINATVDTQRLTIQSPAIQNNNSMSAIDGGILEFNSSGMITQAPGAQILSDNSIVELSSTTIIGGQLNAINGGVFIVDTNSELDGVTNNADLTLNAGRILGLSNFFVNNNQITVNQNNIGAQTSIMITGPLTISGKGSIDLNGFFNRAQFTSFSGTDTLANASGHTITGTGRINTPFLNNGTLSIGSSVGEMDADAPVTMGATGIMIAEVDNFNSADLLDSNSTFHAAGTLDIMLIDDFVPASAWVATIVTADEGVTGEFDTVNFPFVPTDERLENSVGYFENEIRIGAICKSDVNFSGDIDFIDISQFLGDYGDGNLRADLNGDMELDFIDISLFIQSFSAGCP